MTEYEYGRRNKETQENSQKKKITRKTNFLIFLMHILQICFIYFRMNSYAPLSYLHQVHIEGNDLCFCFFFPRLFASLNSTFAFV